MARLPPAARRDTNAAALQDLAWHATRTDLALVPLLAGHFAAARQTSAALDAHAADGDSPPGLLVREHRMLLQQIVQRVDDRRREQERATAEEQAGGDAFGAAMAELLAAEGVPDG